MSQIAWCTMMKVHMAPCVCHKWHISSCRYWTCCHPVKLPQCCTTGCNFTLKLRFFTPCISEHVFRGIWIDRKHFILHLTSTAGGRTSGSITILTIMMRLKAPHTQPPEESIWTSILMQQPILQTLSVLWDWMGCPGPSKGTLLTKISALYLTHVFFIRPTTMSHLGLNNSLSGITAT